MDKDGMRHGFIRTFGTRHLVFYEVSFKDLSGSHDVIECVSYIFEDLLF
jgi:hypothetical protein